MKKRDIPTPHPHHQEASAAITAALGTLSYPVEKDAAIRKVGDWKVPYGEEARVPLAQILEAIPTERFSHVGEATSAVDAHWGRIAETLQGLAATEQDIRAKEKRKHET